MKVQYVFGCLLVSATTGFSGWLNNVGNALLATNTVEAVAAATGAPGSSASTVSADQAVAGLKEALGKGVQSAVKNLGCEGGFLNNLDVKIPLPEKLLKAEAALRIAGQGKLADDFIATMNRAAEQAVPVAAAVFGDAIKQMTFADAKAILTGPNDAATQYFRKTTQASLYNSFLPIVRTATEKVGVTASYKQMIGKVNTVQALGSLMGAKTPAVLSQADLDSYIANKAMDGLFKRVGDEEKLIRTNPLERTTDLLKKVFGSTAR